MQSDIEMSTSEEKGESEHLTETNTQLEEESSNLQLENENNASGLQQENNEEEPKTDRENDCSQPSGSEMLSDEQDESIYQSQRSRDQLQHERDELKKERDQLLEEIGELKQKKAQLRQETQPRHHDILQFQGQFAPVNRRSRTRTRCRNREQLTPFQSEGSVENSVHINSINEEDVEMTGTRLGSGPFGGESVIQTLEILNLWFGLLFLYQMVKAHCNFWNIIEQNLKARYYGKKKS